MRHFIVVILGLLVAPVSWADEALTTPRHVYSLTVSDFVPIQGHGTVQAFTVGLAREVSPRGTLGMQVSWGLSPISFDNDIADVRAAWAASLEARQLLGMGDDIDVFVKAAGGFVVGEQDCEDNLTLPYGQVGIGIQLLLESRSTRSAVALSPELGVVPGILYDYGALSVVAPYMGLQLGIIRD